MTYLGHHTILVDVIIVLFYVIRRGNTASIPDVPNSLPQYDETASAYRAPLILAAVLVMNVGLTYFSTITIIAWHPIL